jgi:hypothetical protein
MADIDYPIPSRALKIKYKDMGDGTHAEVVSAAGGGGGGGGGGDASAANQSTQITAANLANDRLGATNEAAPVSDTATSALNGRLQRIAQRLTSLLAQLPATLGIQTAANSLSIAPASDAVFPASGFAINPSASFTRPADTTAYAVGDIVANSTTAGSVTFPALTVARVAAGSAMLRRLKLHKSTNVTTGAVFRVHLWRAAPATVTNGDNGVFSTSGVADYLGAWDVTVDRAFTDGACGYGVPVRGADQTIKLASGTTIVYGVEALGAYTPGNAEVFTVTLDCLQS